MKIIDARERQKKKDRKEQWGTEAIVKGLELNDFDVHLSLG